MIVVSRIDANNCLVKSDFIDSASTYKIQVREQGTQPFTDIATTHQEIEVGKSIAVAYCNIEIRLEVTTVAGVYLSDLKRASV